MPNLHRLLAGGESYSATQSCSDTLKSVAFVSFSQKPDSVAFVSLSQKPDSAVTEIKLVYSINMLHVHIQPVVQCMS